MNLNRMKQPAKPLVPSTYTGCPKCFEPLSIAEIIENHFGKCGNVTPKEIREERK